MPTIQTQVAVNFTVANRPSSPAEALLTPPEKARGLLSFLTWPFILAQLFWVEHALGDVVRPAPAADLTDTHDLNANNHPNGDDGNGTSLQPFAKSVVDLPVQQDDGPGSHATLGGAAPVAVSAEYLRLNPDSPITGQHSADLLDIGGGGGGGNSPAAVQAGLPGLENSDGTLGHQAGSSVFDDLFGHTGLLSSGSPILTDLSGSHSVDLASPPGAIGQLLTHAEPDIVTALGSVPIGHIIGDTVSLLDAAPPVLVATTAPVVYSVDHLVGDAGSFLDLTPATLAATTDGVTGTVDHVVSTAAPVVELAPTILASATDLGVNAAGHAVSDVGSFLDLTPTTLAASTDRVIGTAAHLVSSAAPVVELAPTILTSAMAPAPTVTDGSTGHLGDAGAAALADPVLSLVSAPGTALGFSSTAPESDGTSIPASAAVTSLPAHDVGFLGSSGTISIADPSPSPIAPDQLFSAGQYTVYGITLSSDATTTTSSAPQALDHGPADMTSTLDPHATTDNTHNHTTVVDHGNDLVASLSHTSSHVGDGIL